MKQRWNQVEKSLEKVIVKSNGDNEPVSIWNENDDLRCIGIGTDAAVFHYEKLPYYAYKVYSEESLKKKDIEASVYEQIKDIPFFPQCYGSGRNYIILSYEEGPTLYDCLLQGIDIPKQVIDDVNEARKLLISKGLNPRDIHLKNVILQNGRGKVLDVSEYVLPGNDFRWEHLEWAFYHIYPLINGVKLSPWLLETIKSWYNRVDKSNFVLEDFSQQIMRLFLGKQKK